VINVEMDTLKLHTPPRTAQAIGVQAAGCSSIAKKRTPYIPKGEFSPGEYLASYCASYTDRAGQGMNRANDYWPDSLICITINRE